MKGGDAYVDISSINAYDRIFQFDCVDHFFYKQKVIHPWVQQFVRVDYLILQADPFEGSTIYLDRLVLPHQRSYLLCVYFYSYYNLILWKIKQVNLIQGLFM